MALRLAQTLRGSSESAEALRRMDTPKHGMERRTDCSEGGGLSRGPWLSPPGRRPLTSAACPRASHVATTARTPFCRIGGRHGRALPRALAMFYPVDPRQYQDQESLLLSLGSAGRLCGTLTRLSFSIRFRSAPLKPGDPLSRRCSRVSATTGLVAKRFIISRRQ